MLVRLVRCFSTARWATGILPSAEAVRKNTYGAELLDQCSRRRFTGWNSSLHTDREDTRANLSHLLEFDWDLCLSNLGSLHDWTQ